jgi:hypothetical protein
MNYYIYIHSKPDGTPFYVGKGHGKRAYDFNRRSRWHKAVTGKYGVKNILVAVTHCESESAAFALEIATITRLRAEGIHMCNFTNGGEGTAGYKPTAEECERRAAALRGRKRPPEVIEKLRAARLGHTHTPEARTKISTALRGRPVSDETKQKISAANKGRQHPPEVIASISEKNRGRKLSAEHKAKIVSANTGKKRSPEAIANMKQAAANRRDALLKQLREASAKRGPVSEATRRKQSAARTGKVFTPEHKANLSAARVGHEVSAATRKAIALANTGRRHTEAAKAKMSATKKAKRATFVTGVTD